jgi:PAS domain S-box-containing protein
MVAVRNALRHRDEQMRQVLDALPAAIYTTDEYGKITYYNRAAADLAGREPTLGVDEWCVTYKLFTLDGQPLPHDQCPMAVALKENRPIRGVEAMALRPDGSIFPLIPFPTPLRDENGALVGAVNMLVDVSDRKAAESNQRVLLNELNHRVKNNLQMLHGLLRQSGRETSYPEAQRVLAEAAQRVASIAAAQQLLYSEDQPRGFSACEFLKAVSAAARQAFRPNISVELDCKDFELANDTAMPLALIVNELMTNAAKHAFGEEQPGEIRLSFEEHPTEFVLAVEDSGPGKTAQPGTGRSSGLGLIQGLARQLGAQFETRPGPGTKSILRIPRSMTLH